MKIKSKFKIGLCFATSCLVLFSTGFASYVVSNQPKVSIEVSKSPIEVDNYIFFNYDNSSDNVLKFDVVNSTDKNGQNKTFYVDDNCQLKLTFLWQKYVSNPTENVDFGLFINFDFTSLNSIFTNHVLSIVENNFLSLKYTSPIGSESVVELNSSSLYTPVKNGTSGLKPYELHNNLLTIHIPFSSEHSAQSNFYLTYLNQFGISTNFDFHINFDFQFVDPDFGYMTLLDDFDASKLNVKIGVERYL